MLLSGDSSLLVSGKQKDQIFELLVAEFCETGLQEDSEPTKRGKHLDDLSGYFYRYE